MRFAGRYEIITVTRGLSPWCLPSARSGAFIDRSTSDPLWRCRSHFSGCRIRGSGRAETHHLAIPAKHYHAFSGMTKNILEGLAGRLWLAPAVILLPVLIFWTPVCCAVVGLIDGEPLLFTAVVATYVLQFAILWLARRLFEFQPAKALLFPLAAVPHGFCMVRSLFLYVLKEAVDWRGRTLPVRASRIGR
jgi:hypothetical protein